MSEDLKEIYRTLETRVIHEGRTIDTSFYQDIAKDTLAKFIRIGFKCLLNLNVEICHRFIMEFCKTLRLDRYLEPDNRLFMTFDIIRREFNISIDPFAELTSLPNQGICLYSDAWTYQRVTFKKQTKQGIMQKLPKQIETNELFDHLKPCELINRENAYVAIRNRDHVQASIALMLYCLEACRPFNLAYFVIRRMDYFRDRVEKVLPYGMILTRIFKNLRATMEDHPFDDRYILVTRKMSFLKAKQPRKPPLKKPINVGKSKRAQLPSSSSSKLAPLDDGEFPSTKLSPRSYNKALIARENMSNEQRETRGMFKNMARALHIWEGC
ncbi:hypothetical protein Tco_0670290 [Tanacetum coccineum]